MPNRCRCFNEAPGKGLEFLIHDRSGEVSLPLSYTYENGKMKIIEINNVSYTVGSNQKREGLPRLLMLHGFMGDHRAFNHLIDNLGKFCNPITVDLLGHGRSSKPANPERYYEKQQVDDLAALIGKLNISPLFLHGYSMGGRLALKTALAHPDFFRGLILESTNCGITDDQERKQRRQTDCQRANRITDNFEHFLRHWQQLPLFESPGPVDLKLREKYAAIQQSQSPEAIAASLRGFGSGRMQPCCEELSRLQLPALLMAVS